MACRQDRHTSSRIMCQTALVPARLSPAARCGCVHLEIQRLSAGVNSNPSALPVQSCVCSALRISTKLCMSHAMVHGQLSTKVSAPQVPLPR